jgi:uncharacterized surface protein with fasciclin (FAS1) repeats
VTDALKSDILKYSRRKQGFWHHNQLNGGENLKNKISALSLILSLFLGLYLPLIRAQPTLDIVETAEADGNFTTLISALEATDLNSTLKAPGPFTVFAPTDDAFAALNTDVLNWLLANPTALSEVLLYHVVSGAYNSTDVTALSSIQTLQGDNLSITVDTTVMIDGANITVLDIECTNGIIHVIDAVMRAHTDVTSPSVSNVSQDPEIPDDGEAATITAFVTDAESGVYSVILSYSTDGEQTWNNVTMTNTTGDTYEGQIPGLPAETEVQYEIIAYDNIGNPAVENNAGEYYVYTVIPEFSSVALISIFLILSLLTTVLMKKSKRINL